MYSLETMTGFPLKVKRVILPLSGGALKCFYWYLFTRIFELLSSSSDLPKGQLILKYLFGIFNSPQMEQKMILLLLYLKSNCFRLIFGRIENTKKTFRNQLTFSVVAMNICLPVFVFTMGRNHLWCGILNFSWISYILRRLRNFAKSSPYFCPM